MGEHAMSPPSSGFALVVRIHQALSPPAVPPSTFIIQAVPADALKQEFAGCLQRLVVSITGDEQPSRAALQAVSVP